MEDLIKNQGVHAQPLPDPIVEALRVANTKILEDAVAKDPVAKKVNDSPGSTALSISSAVSPHGRPLHLRS